MQTLFTQVLLRDGNRSQVTWIPKEVAVRGNRVAAKESPDVVWTVDQVYGTCDSEYLTKQRQAGQRWESVLK